MRIQEIDFLKCMFIILMVIFHLVYIGDKYPILKDIVYSFHMPAFLLISGYLTNVRDKNIRQFFCGVLWIFIPYAVMTIGYTFMASVLPVRENVHDVSVIIFLQKVFLTPIGPYWYLHTLIICNIVNYLVYHGMGKNLGVIQMNIIFALLLYSLSYVSLLSFGNALFYILGVYIKQSKYNLMEIISPTVLSVIPFTLLCLLPDGIDRASLQCIAITYCAMCMFCLLHDVVSAKMKSLCCFIGRNTFLILLFSPIFTFMSKSYLPVFSFDPSGSCFTVVSVVFTIGGCILIGYCSDKLHLSAFAFGKYKILN